MARIPGRNGAVYIDQTSGATGSASPVSFISKWSLAANSDQFDVTALGDGSKVYVAGLPDAKGTVSGFFDDTASTGSTSLFTVAQSALARKTYLYPKTPSSAGPYFWGTCFWSFSYDIDVGGAVAISGDFAAATPLAVVG